MPAGCDLVSSTPAGASRLWWWIRNRLLRFWRRAARRLSGLVLYRLQASTFRNFFSSFSALSLRGLVLRSRAPG